MWRLVLRKYILQAFQLGVLRKVYRPKKDEMRVSGYYVTRDFMIYTCCLEL
jgi:hypothetical protein